MIQSNILRKKYIQVLIISLATIPTFFSLLRPGFFPMHDDLQAFRIHQMDKCFGDFQIPCRWVPDAGYQYGYPLFIFYPPSVYYLGELIYLTGFQFIDSVKVLFILGFLSSSLAMYFFLKDWLGEGVPAFLGAILYSYAPYRAVDVYVRGAMSEFWSLTFFPLIFWAIYKIIKHHQTGRFSFLRQNLKFIVFLGISTGGLLLTHNLMTIIFLPIALVWTILLIVLEKKYYAVLPLVVGGLLGFGLASFFSLPVYFEKEYAHLESLVGGYFDYRQHFVNVSQLFLENEWGYGSSVYGLNDDLSLSTGPLHFLVGIISIFLALVNFKDFRKLSLITLILGILELSVLFMIHQRSSFIWEKLPFLEYLQFPWRFLANSIFILSILGAIGVKFIERVKLRIIFVGVILIGIAILHLSFFQPRAWYQITDKDKFSGSSWEKQLTISIFDYLPIYAKLPPIHKAPDKPEILEGRAEILSWRKGSNWQEGRLRVNELAAIRVPLFDFPGMTVTAKTNNQEFTYGHKHDDCRGQEFCLGLITFYPSKGDFDVRVQLTNTPIRTIGNILTLLSILMLGLFLYISFRPGGFRR